MRKSVFAFVLFLASPLAMLPTLASGQTSAPLEWTWMWAGNTPAASVYGTLGIPAATNAPGYRMSGASWTGLDGRLLLFGGSASTELNDLWIYDPASNMWTWEGGKTSNAPAVYGEIGVPDPGNTPGGRHSAATWVDAKGKFWLFGGKSDEASIDSALHNDLWMFDPVSMEWTWEWGSKGVNAIGQYGTQGVAAASNAPGARYGAVTWSDSEGRIWLFSGLGCDSTGVCYILNDVWMLDPASMLWTWESGSDLNGNNGHGGLVVGQQGVPSASNMPAARYGGSGWKDQSGKFWLFGGLSIDYRLNDLWMFDPGTKEWTWETGHPTEMPSGLEYPGVYGTLGVASATNTPGARWQNTSWSSADGNLWLWGGYGMALQSEGYLNDLWMFSPRTLEWTWQGGSDLPNANASYGTLGEASSLNDPGGLAFTTSWIDEGGNIWQFSGTDQQDSISNVLWLFENRVAQPVFSLPTATYTSGQTVSIDTADRGAVVYYTTDGSTPTSGSNVYSGPFSVNSTETIKAVAEVSGYPPSIISSVTYTINLPAATPTFSPVAGAYTSAQSVTISTSTPNATIYYTTSGETPTSDSAVYGGPITVRSTETLEAVAIASGCSLSGVASALYTINLPAATPTISPASGAYSSTQSVTISDATAGATIYYTTDGTTPTASSAKYTGAITVSSTETIEAMATGGGYSDSNVATAVYTITLPAATPTFSVAPGTYPTAQTVSITDATTGVTIYYTTDGTTPTPSSTKYGGAISVSSTETLKAIATGSGYTTSAVATAAYVITNPVPAIGSISPAFASAGGPAFQLTLNGTGFAATSVAYWGSSALATQFVNPKQVTAQVPVSDIAAAGSTAVTVQTPAPGGGVSNSFQFEVDSASSATTAPTFTQATATVLAGSTATYTATFPATVTSATATCLNLPTGATCSYSSATNALTITTSSSTTSGTYQITAVFSETVQGAATAGFLVPLLLLPIVLIRRKLANRDMWGMACLGVVLATTAACTACGGGGSSSTSTPPSNPTHQVTSSGSVTLTIQ